MALQETEWYREVRIRHYPQCIKALIPLHALCCTPHRSCLPYSLPVGHINIKLPLFPKDGPETWKVVRSMDWWGKENLYLSIKAGSWGERTSDLGATDRRYSGVMRTSAVVMVENGRHRM
jgi:hypothetical protein